MRRCFLGIALDKDTPDHSTISRTRQLIDLGDAQRGVFLGAAPVCRWGLLAGKRIGIDVTSWRQRGDALDHVARHGREF